MTVIGRFEPLNPKTRHGLNPTHRRLSKPSCIALATLVAYWQSMLALQVLQVKAR